jgi:Zn-dependent protease
MDGLYVMLLWYFVFLLSLVAHEASHAWAFMRLGDDTAYEEGQVTLDPVPHMRREPVGTVLVPLLTYFLNGWMMGWGSAPYNARWAYHYPRSAAWASFAGPSANLGLAVIAGIIIRAGIFFNLFYAPDSINFDTVVATSRGGIIQPLTFLLSITFSLNVLLFIFNLLPFPPLDGSGVIPLFLRGEEAAVKYLHFISNPPFQIFGLLMAWHIMDFIFYPVHVGFVNAMYWGLAHY